jgi:hypothetical protein
MATVDTFRRGIVPRATDDEVNQLVWCCSPYPFCRDVRKLRRSIRRYLKLGGGTIQGALNYAHEELDRDMEAARKSPGAEDA